MVLTPKTIGVANKSSQTKHFSKWYLYLLGRNIELICQISQLKLTIKVIFEILYY